MENIKLQIESGVGVLELNRGRANPINMEMMREIHKVVKQLAEDDSVRGLILTGSPGFFSVGLDVMELVSLDEQGLDRFWREFFRLMKALVGFQKPLICAVSGYAPAGGCVLSLCCDYVLMADGDFRIGLNEIEVGLFVPRPILDLLISRVGQDKASQLVLDSRMLTPGQAQRFGLVHELCDCAELMTRANSLINRWLKWDAESWKKTKVELKAPTLERWEQPFDDLIERIKRHWKNPGTLESLNRVVNALKKT